MRSNLNPFKILFLSLIVSFTFSQNKIKIVEYRQIPKELEALRLTPNRINWSLGNSFLLLDSFNSELLLFKNSGEIKISGGVGRHHNVYGELIWVGISPIGIQVVDRLENEIIVLDLNLNRMHNISLNHNLYPEIAQIDPWGRLFMSSSTFNGIYLFENGYVSNEPFIDFSREFYLNYCVKDFAISSDGEIAILGCDGIFNEFSQNGLKQNSIPVGIHNPQFLVSLRDDWFVFNPNGECFSISNFDKISMPKINSPILDIATINRSMAILTKEQILVLNVK